VPRYNVDNLPPTKSLVVKDLENNTLIPNPLAVNTDEGWVECMSGVARIRLHGLYQAMLVDKTDSMPRSIAPGPQVKPVRRGRF
jgi:hypothetical protein